MKATVRNHLAAVLLLAPLGAAMVAQPAAAQQAVVAPEIRSIAIDSDAGLAPGATLRVEVYATPGARVAHVGIGDSGTRVALREREPGHYVGQHVIRRSDRIDARDLMAVRATYGDRSIARTFDFPPAFRTRAMGAAPAVAPAAVIERFVVHPRGRIAPGRELRFRLAGAPGGDAWVDIPGVIRGIDLQETRPGVYEGSYTVRRRDDLGAFDRAVASLRLGNQRATARAEFRDNDRDEHAGRDERAPRIFSLAPGNGDRISQQGRAHIYARLDDQGSGVDPDSVRLRVDGRDVTANTRVSPEEVRYGENLPRGRHTAELVVRDRAGNAARTVWTFDVV